MGRTGKKKKRTGPGRSGARAASLRDARYDFCRSAIARERYVHEIVTEARANPLFVNRSTGKPFSGAHIKINFIYVVRKLMREQRLDAEEELIKAYHRLTYAFRVAVDRDDPKAMALVQKTVNRMLGLRREPVLNDGIDPERLRQQLTEIHESVGGNGK